MSYESFYKTYLPDLKGSKKQKRATCPFCGHKNDFSINLETGQCKCFYGGCLFKGDAFNFLRQLKNLSFSEAKAELSNYGIQPLKDNPLLQKGESTIEGMSLISQNQVENYVKTLSDEETQFLKEVRGISSEVIEKYKIGYHKVKKRFVIPITQGERCVNIRLYSPDQEPKILPISSGRSIQLYPEDQFKNNELWLTEGELDALCGISHGLPCVTVTGGAGSWKEEFTPLFKGKKINIVYDCDEAGRKGAEKVAETLHKVAQVKVINLGLKEGEDLTNWFVDYGKSKEELEKLADKTPIFEKLTPAQKKIRELTKEIKIQSISASELLKKDFPPGQFWVEKGLIPKGGYILLAGPTKEGKTTLSLQLSLHLATKTTFLNQFPVPKKARILYLFAENTLEGLKRILQKQVMGAEKFGWEISNENLKNLILQPGHRINFSYEKGIQLTDELIREHSPDIVILDPISLFVSKDLNKLENVTQLVTNLLDIGAKRDCTWIIISHYKKPSEQKMDPIYQVIGSSGFGNYCESFLGLERYHERRSAHYKILHFLLRQEETPDPICLYRNPETLLFETVAKQKAIQAGAKPEDVARVLKEKFGGKTSYSLLTSLVAEEFGITKARVGELLKEAKEKRLVAKERGQFGEWYAL